jgi:hypothetical protein
MTSSTATPEYLSIPATALVEIGREAVGALIARGGLADVEVFGTVVTYGGPDDEDFTVEFGVLKAAAEAVGLTEDFDARFAGVEVCPPDHAEVAALAAADAADAAEEAAEVAAD